MGRGASIPPIEPYTRKEDSMGPTLLLLEAALEESIPIPEEIPEYPSPEEVWEMYQEDIRAYWCSDCYSWESYSELAGHWEE